MNVREHIAEWCKNNKQVRACYLSPNRNPTFYIIPDANQFDFDLADKLTELHQEILANHKVNVGLHQIPERSLQMFVPAGKEVKLY